MKRILADHAGWSVLASHLGGHPGPHSSKQIGPGILKPRIWFFFFLVSLVVKSQALLLLTVTTLCYCTEKTVPGRVSKTPVSCLPLGELGSVVFTPCLPGASGLCQTVTLGVCTEPSFLGCPWAGPELLPSPAHTCFPGDLKLSHGMHLFLIWAQTHKSVGVFLFTEEREKGDWLQHGSH